MLLMAESGLLSMASGAPAWTPALFPSVTGWWEADDLSGIASGADVTSWPAHNALGNTWGQRATGTYPDKLLTDGVHSVDFAEANSESLDSTDTLATLIGDVGLCALVVSMTGVPSTPFTSFYDGNTIIGDNGGYWGISATTDAGTPYYVGGVYDAGHRSRYLAATPGSIDFIILYRTSAGELTLSLNGSESTLASVGVPQQSSGIMQLGVNYNATQFFNGKLYAIMTASDVGTVNDRVALLDYLRTKYLPPTLLSPPIGYELAFSDEFDYTGPPDPAKWVSETGSDSTYATVANGKLTLRCTGTSVANRIRGSIRTSDSAYMTWWGRGDFNFDHMWQAPGWLEISMKPSEVAGVMSNMVVWTDFVENPLGSGLWELGEIDVCEARGIHPGTVEIASHIWREIVPGGIEPSVPIGDWMNIGGGSSAFVGADRFHQFVCEWDATYVRIYVDGTLYHERNVGSDPYPVFGHPSLLILEAMIAVDGTWGAGYDTVTYPVDTAMEVAYVRFYRPAT